jgi:hypothetical protein
LVKRHSCWDVDATNSIKSGGFSAVEECIVSGGEKDEEDEEELRGSATVEVGIRGVVSSSMSCTL